MKDSYFRVSFFGIIWRRIYFTMAKLIKLNIEKLPVTVILWKHVKRLLIKAFEF